MLILARVAGAKIRIGDQVTITVLRMQNGYIDLGITAPRTMSVHRSEVYQRIQAEKAGLSDVRGRPSGDEEGL